MGFGPIDMLVLYKCMCPCIDVLVGFCVQPAATKPSLSQVNLHGSVILQHMLRFDDPSPVVDSLLSLDPPQLVQLACNPCGSHVVDTYYKSPSVSGNRKEQMIQRLKVGFLFCS